MDEKEYLQPDFDPASYKIPQLRNVLLQNDVSYPGNAKKKDLVALFNENIKPKAEERLKFLNGVVANHEGIEVVANNDKSTKSKSKSKATKAEDDIDQVQTLKVEKTRKSKKLSTPEPEPVPEVRKSPRKTSKSAKLEESEEIVEKSPRKTKASSRNASGNDLGKIPDLKISPPRTRERSPRRKASAKSADEDEPEALDVEQLKPIRARSPRRKTTKAKKEVDDDESEQIEEFKPRERSPRRKVSEKKESVTRERSPTKKSVKKETKKEIKSENDEDDVVQVSQKDFEKEARSPFKFGSKAAFSNDNVFQSPGHSSPADHQQPKKSIPRKRASDNASPVKSPRKSTKTARKTAFSSSPEPSQNVKSPAKKSLEISKFEASSPPSNFVKNEVSNADIFDLDEISNVKENFNFDNVTEKVEKVEKKVENLPFHHTKFIEEENFETPNEGNASRISNLESSPSETPSKSSSKRKNIFQRYAESLGVVIQGDFKDEPEQKKEEPAEEEQKPKDDELIDDEDEEEGEEEEEEEEEAEISVNDDSVLRNLQEEIDFANSAVQKEANDAIKQIDDIFNEEKSENKEEEEEELTSVEKTASKPLINFWAIFSALGQICIFFFFTFTVIAALWYREQRILIGYCGSEIDQPTFPNAQNEYLIKFDDFLQTLKPSCLEAPEHAITLPHLKIKCRPDYVVYQPWYKIHGFLPISDYCVKDEEKENIIKEVVSKTLELLRTKNANYKCGDGDDLEVGISDEELYEFFFNSKSSSISDEEFDELWSRVLIDLKNEPELTVRHVFLKPIFRYPKLLTIKKLRYTGVDDSRSTEDDISTDENEEETNISKESIIFRSNSKLKLSIKCKFQKEISENFERNKNLLIGTTLILILGLTLYQKFLSYQKTQSKIKEISEIIIIKLQNQQKNSILDSTGLTNRYLSNIQLRDELLTNLKNSEKYKIWDSILNNIEKNSNIRSSTKEIHGEIVKVLEWIGEQ